MLIPGMLVNVNHLEHRIPRYHKLLLPTRKCSDNRGTLRHPNHNFALVRSFHDVVLQACTDKPTIHEMVARLKLRVYVEMSIAEYNEVFRCGIPLGDCRTD